MKKLIIASALVCAAFQANAENKVFRISTNQTDLILQVGDNGRLYQTYLGEKLLHEEDIRYADFQAFKKRQVIYCNMSEKPFYESMPVEPETVLADLIAVFHPQLLPNHTPRYYELLK